MKCEQNVILPVTKCELFPNGSMERYNPCSNDQLGEKCSEPEKTSRERPKSATYLRLKKTTFSTTGDNKALKKLKIEKKNFRIFFGIFSEVSGFLKSHSAKKCKRGDALGFFEHPFCCKISKIDGRNNLKNFGKKSVSQCRKKEESLIVSKKVDPSALEWLFISC